MASFDYRISHFFASLNGISPEFDRLVWMLSANALLKGGVLCAFLWLAWFTEVGRCTRVRARVRQDRLAILGVLISSAVAEVVARLLSLTLPFRPRPLFDGSLPFRLPEGITLDSLNIAGESSFPSDHGVLFCALCAGIWLVSRRAAIVGMLWVIVMILLPRLYLGLHYASDLIVGGLIGVIIAMIGAQVVPHLALLKTIVLRSRTHPALFYPLFFLAMHQIANMLIDLRAMAGAVRDMV